MKKIKNISKTNVFINDINLLMKPDQIIDLDLVLEIKKLGGSLDLSRMLSAGKLQEMEEEQEDCAQIQSFEEKNNSIRQLIKQSIREIIQEELYNISNDSNKLNESNKLSGNLDFDEIAATIHLNREDEIDCATIKSEEKIIKSSKTDNLSDLLKEQPGRDKNAKE